MCHCCFGKVFYIHNNLCIFISDSNIKDYNLHMHIDHFKTGHLHEKHAKQHVLFASGKWMLWPKISKNPHLKEIYCHPQTVSLYHNSSVWLDTKDASSWDQNPPNFTLDLIIIPLGQQATYVSLVTYNAFCINFHFFFYIFTLLDTRVLNSLEELSITRVAVINSFTRVLNTWEGCIYIWNEHHNFCYHKIRIGYF